MLSSKKTTQYLFVAYLFLLSWCILLKFETQLENIVFFRDNRVINWIPFAQPTIVNGEVVKPRWFSISSSLSPLVFAYP